MSRLDACHIPSPNGHRLFPEREAKNASGSTHELNVKSSHDSMSSRVIVRNDRHDR